VVKLCYIVIYGYFFLNIFIKSFWQMVSSFMKHLKVVKSQHLPYDLDCLHCNEKLLGLKREVILILRYVKAETF
jgi:hypothetical protein